MLCNMTSTVSAYTDKINQTVKDKKLTSKDNGWKVPVRLVDSCLVNEATMTNTIGTDQNTNDNNKHNNINKHLDDNIHGYSNTAMTTRTIHALLQTTKPHREPTHNHHKRQNSDKDNNLNNTITNKRFDNNITAIIQ